MKQPTNLELTLCDGLPWGLRMCMKGAENITTELNFSTLSVWISLCEKSGLPILFPLSALTKEITVNGETFVPIVELAKCCAAFDFGEKFDLDRPVTFRENGVFYTYDDVRYSFSFNGSGFIYMIDWKGKDTRHVNQNKAFDLLNQWHFNTRNLPADQFINAHESKVY